MKKSITLVGLGALALVSGYLTLRSPTVSTEQVARIRGVQSILEEKGKSPQVIYVGQSHAMISGAPLYDTISSIESICLELYDKHNVRSLFLEGVSGRQAKEYAQTGRLTIRAPKEQAAYIARSMEVLTKRKWNLYPEDYAVINKVNPIEAPLLERIGSLRKDVLEIPYECAISFGKVENGVVYVKKERHPEFDKAVRAKIAALTGDALRDLEALLTPEKVIALHDVLINQREESIVKTAKKCNEDGKGPLIVVYGISHMITLPKRSVDLDYVVIKPQGIGPKATISSEPDDIKQMYLDMAKEATNFQINMKLY